MAGEIIWTYKAKEELIEILEYWNNNNNSNAFSIKLNTLINEKLILEFPLIGTKTDINNVFVKVIKNYLLYYEIIEDSIYILTIRHKSKNPKTLKIK